VLKEKRGDVRSYRTEGQGPPGPGGKRKKKKTARVHGKEKEGNSGIVKRSEQADDPAYIEGRGEGGGVSLE